MIGLRGAVGFLTVLPGAATLDARTVRWFPVVGAVVGAAVGLVWWGSGELVAPGLAAVLAVAADAVLTGGLHLDGVADSGDGLLPHLERRDRLRVMREPTVGAFAVIVVVLVLLVRTEAFAASAAVVWVPMVLWAGSRSMAALALAVAPTARPDGLGAALAEGRPAAAVIGLAAAAAVAAVAVGVAAVGALATMAIGSWAVVALGRRRLGGVTGDVLGAAIVIGETAGLVAWAGLS